MYAVSKILPTLNNKVFDTAAPPRNFYDDLKVAAALTSEYESAKQAETLTQDEQKIVKKYADRFDIKTVSEDFTYDKYLDRASFPVKENKKIETLYFGEDVIGYLSEKKYLKAFAFTSEITKDHKLFGGDEKKFSSAEIVSGVGTKFLNRDRKSLDYYQAKVLTEAMAAQIAPEARFVMIIEYLLNERREGMAYQPHIAQSLNSGIVNIAADAVVKILKPLGIYTGNDIAIVEAFCADLIKEFRKDMNRYNIERHTLLKDALNKIAKKSKSKTEIDLFKQLSDAYAQTLDETSTPEKIKSVKFTLRLDHTPHM